MNVFPQEKKLPNGVRIITANVKTVDFIHFEIISKIGSGMERLENQGITHLIEHLLLSCSSIYTETHIFKRTIEENGGVFNGSTSQNSTRFYIKVPKTEFNFGMDFILEILKTSTLNRKVLEEQIKVISSEQADTVSKFGRDFYYRMRARYWGNNHPYALDTLGVPTILETFSEETLLNYMLELLNPRNITVLLVGNFEATQLDKLLYNLNLLSSSLRVESSYYPTDVFSYGINETFNEPACKNMLVSASIPLKKYNSLDPETILYNAFVSDALTKTLREELRGKKNLLYSLRSFISRITPGLFWYRVEFSATAGTIEDTIAILFERWKQVNISGINAKEFSHYKKMAINSYMLRNQSDFDKAMAYCIDLADYGHYTPDEDLLQLKKHLTNEMVNHILNEEYKPEQANLYVYGDMTDKKLDLGRLR